MGAVHCPIHGTRIASVMCEHVAAAVDARRPMRVYLQKDSWGWYTLCDACARRRDDPELQDELGLVCGECVDEWAVATGSDYSQRFENRVSESPEGEPAEGS